MSQKPPSTDQPRDKAGAKVVFWLLFGLVVVFGGLYAAAHYAAGDKVPRNTTVSGVRIGGHSQAEAAQRLEAGLADKVNRPIATTIGGEDAEVDPAALGLRVDYDASVAEAGGEESWDPVRLWNYFTGGDALDAVVTVDEAAYQTSLATLDEQHGTPAVDGTVTFEGAEIAKTDPTTGKALDPSDTLTALRAAYLQDDPAVVALELTDVVPDIDASDVQEALDTFASPAVAAPVTLSFDGSDVKVFPADYTEALSLVPTDGELVPTLDAAKLTEVVGSKVTAGAAVDASVALVDGRPQVIPARPGVTFDDQQLEDGFLDAVAKPQGERTLTLDAKVAQPAFTTKDARALQVKERVSSFTTYFPYAEYRNVNIGRAAELINGTLLKPGETFSLNDTVGERTEENGFTEGYVINDGILVTDLGGGVSQMATTTFNAMFYAGLEDVEHKPHSFYIDRYPVGREATVAWGAVDLRFKNDTPYGVLIQANVTPSTPSSSGVATVSMWSTKYWDITDSTGERYNLTKPKTRRVDTVQCHPNTGYGGFDIDVVRYFRPVGANTETRGDETFHTTYTPSDTVICTNPDATDG
ncbi:Vancomycin resistance protein YoaR, contains peptidoglycan-binding and VanW domains [Nocardioides exalbidus]|uniref:Vancomycin resistance protein YoaR, contains peptidoglycan-binding and VanW domains n=1 Tax=Nocardioides exalbidus TaxID=402596 RepID=A0A1H4JYI0_9ACTN|nr:VanW family protein [Nocardioides exalbidus]SEB51207.1 Vancomycin resistance protein YoaR, contains peptidoglycan-binding and VanW domains [Nocardioides exalbidus]